MKIGFKSIQFLFVVIITLFTSVTACENKNNRRPNRETSVIDAGDKNDDSHDKDITKTTTITSRKDGGDNTQDDDTTNTQDDMSASDCVDVNHIIGTSCGLCNTGVYKCFTDTIQCEDPLQEKPIPGDSCGQCNTGIYLCNTDNSDIQCEDPLSNDPQVGSSCGKCETGNYACNENGDAIVCNDSLYYKPDIGVSCGGKCNTATYQCSTNTQDIVCIDPLANSFTPKDNCTTNGEAGAYQCTDNNTKISCIISQGNHLWSKLFGDSSEQAAHSISTDASGNVFITGYFEGSVDFGGGTLNSAGLRDIFIAKFDAQGNHLWSERFGDSKAQNSNGIVTDASGNVFITGYFEGSVDFGGGTLNSAGLRDIFIAEFDAQGNHLWSKRFGDSSDQFVKSIVTDARGNVFITGNFYSSVDFGGGVLTSAGYYDIFIAEFDAQGNYLWSKRFGDSSDQFVKSIVTDARGNVLITGYFSGSVNFGGGILTSAGSNDIYIAKFDTQGNHLWSKRFGDSSYQHGYSITTDTSGNVFITGEFWGSVDFGGGILTSAGSNDIYIAKFDTQGNHLWSKRFGDEDYQLSESVVTDASGNVFITGFFFGSVDFGGGIFTSAGGPDIFIAKLDGVGNLLWSKRFDGLGGELFNHSVVTDASGNVFITGFVIGSVDFGGGFLYGAGRWMDIYIAKFAP